VLAPVAKVLAMTLSAMSLASARLFGLRQCPRGPITVLTICSKLMWVSDCRHCFAMFLSTSKNCRSVHRWRASYSWLCLKPHLFGRRAGRVDRSRSWVVRGPFSILMTPVNSPFRIRRWWTFVMDCDSGLRSASDPTSCSGVLVSKSSFRDPQDTRRRKGG
jgi:hypothetical protein